MSSGGATGDVKVAGVQEILPWLKLAADMNPQMVEAYTVGAYWLRTGLNKPKEAQAFLFEGLHNNPGNAELMFDLGRLYDESYHDTNRARNIWTAALRNLELQSADLKTNTESQFVCDEISMNLAHLEEASGNLSNAVHYLEIVKQVSPNPAAIQKQIDEIRQKLAAQPSANQRAGALNAQLRFVFRAALWFNRRNESTSGKNFAEHERNKNLRRPQP